MKFSLINWTILHQKMQTYPIIRLEKSGKGVFVRGNSIKKEAPLSRLERGTAGLCIQEMVFHPVVWRSTRSIQYRDKGEICPSSL